MITAGETEGRAEKVFETEDMKRGAGTELAGETNLQEK